MPAVKARPDYDDSIAGQILEDSEIPEGNSLVNQYWGA